MTRVTRQRLVTPEACTHSSSTPARGIGHGHCELRESGLLESVLEAAASKPLFGVCVGMQVLLYHSAEGDTPGLGLMHGDVLKFDLAGRVFKDVPAPTNLVIPPYTFVAAAAVRIGDGEA